MSLDQIATPGLITESATPEGANANAEDTNAYNGFSSPDEEGPRDAADDQATEGTENESEQQEPDPWDGYEDYELNGVVKKIPTEWKENLMLKADHTRRLQELAENKKQVQARESELAQRFQQTEEEFNAHVELANLRSQLKAAEGINWNEEYQKILNDPSLRNDPLGQQEAINKFQAVYMQWQELKGREGALQQTATDLAKKRIETGDQETAKRLSATLDFAQKNIKGWTPELDVKITQFAMSEGGYDAETLKNGMNPQNYRMLHLAYLGHQSQLRQQSAKPNSPLQKPLAPTQTVTAKANTSSVFDPEKSSMEDYAREWAKRQPKR